VYAKTRLAVVYCCSPQSEAELTSETRFGEARLYFSWLPMFDRIVREMSE